MKYAFYYILVFMFGTALGYTEKTPFSLKITAQVVDKGEKTITIRVDDVISVGENILVIPREGELITVRTSEERKPRKGTTVIIDLKESISIGANASSYRLLNYKTID